MVWLLRFILLFLILFFVYMAVKLLFNTNRKLESARKQKQFLLIDHTDIRKNFLLTYKGVIFAGEKYSNKENVVVSILISARNSRTLIGLSKLDLQFIEKQIQKKYPLATINWGSHVNEYLQQIDQ